MPIVGLVGLRSPEESTRLGAAFRKALNETCYIEAQNVMVEYHWLEVKYDRLPALMADLVRRRVAVIATPAFGAAIPVAKAATTTIPILFGVAEDPVKLGLVASLARPGGNATGINFFATEVAAKRLGLGYTKGLKSRLLSEHPGCKIVAAIEGLGLLMTHLGPKGLLFVAMHTH